MDRISRRQVVRGAGAAAAMTLGAPSVHAQNDRQTLRFVAQADLKILDPIWTTAYITRNHGYLVYDTLFGTDEHFQIKPQMVDRTTVSPDGMKYTFTLRDGLRWHDGQPVVSEDCVESLKRWGQEGSLRPAPHGAYREDRAGRQEDFHARARRALRPGARGAGKAVQQCALHDAGADRVHARGGADQGDRRLRTVQVRAGRVATGRAGRVPAQLRLRPARRAHRVDQPAARRCTSTRSIWRYIPDPWDAADDLAAGEVDWWEEPPIDFIPKIEQNPDLTDVSHRSARDARLAQAELAPPAVQQQEGAPGAAPHDGPGDVSRLGDRTVAILPALLFGICLRRPLRDEHRCRADDGARPHKSEAAREGVGLRWPADRACSTSPTGRSSTPQRSSRANGWSRSASRSSSRRWIGRRTWSRGHARSRPTRAAGTCFSRGG